MVTYWRVAKVTIVCGCGTGTRENICVFSKGIRMRCIRSPFTPNGKTLVSCGADFALRFWDVATGQERHSLRTYPQNPKCLAFAPDGDLLASAGYGNAIQLWQIDRTSGMPEQSGATKRMDQPPASRMPPSTGIAMNSTTLSSALCTKGSRAC